MPGATRAREGPLGARARAQGGVRPASTRGGSPQWKKANGGGGECEGERASPNGEGERIRAGKRRIDEREREQRGEHTADGPGRELDHEPSLGLMV